MQVELQGCGVQGADAIQLGVGRDQLPGGGFSEVLPCEALVLLASDHSQLDDLAFAPEVLVDVCSLLQVGPIVRRLRLSTCLTCSSPPRSKVMGQSGEESRAPDVPLEASIPLELACFLALEPLRHPLLPLSPQYLEVAKQLQTYLVKMEARALAALVQDQVILPLSAARPGPAKGRQQETGWSSLRLNDRGELESSPLNGEAAPG